MLAATEGVFGLILVERGTFSSADFPTSIITDQQTCVPKIIYGVGVGHTLLSGEARRCMSFAQRRTLNESCCIVCLLRAELGAGRDEEIKAAAVELAESQTSPFCRRCPQ